MANVHEKRFLQCDSVMDLPE